MSASLTLVNHDESSGKSFILELMLSVIPSTDPCGTPTGINFHSDWIPFKTTRCFLPHRFSSRAS